MIKKLLSTACVLSVLAVVPAQAAESGSTYMTFNVGADKNTKSKTNGLKLKNSVTPSFAIGAGMQLTDNFRTDFVVDYKNLKSKYSTTQVSDPDIKAQIAGATTIGDTATTTTTLEQNKLSMRSFSTMLNGYYDVGQFGVFKPYVGAGVGLAFNKFKVTSSATSTTSVVTVTATGPSDPVVTGPTAIPVKPVQYKNKTNFAFQATVGTAINVASNVDLDVAYKYANLGKPAKGKGLKSVAVNQVTFGLRYSF
jgi:opacity protein-like surface antigen